MPTSETTGFVSAWKAKAHGSLGPVNALLGVDGVNVRYRCTRWCPHKRTPSTEQKRTITASPCFSLSSGCCNKSLPSSTDFDRKVLSAKDGKKRIWKLPACARAA